MNKEFEKLKEVAEALQFVDGFDGNKYHSLNNHRTADWLNGALYAYQEQHKKVLEIMLDNLGDEFNDLRSPSYDAMLYALREIKELLK